MVFESPLVDGEALITVSDLSVDSAGFHMEHHLKENYYDIITEENQFKQQYYQQAYMGFMRNPGGCCYLSIAVVQPVNTAKLNFYV